MSRIPPEERPSARQLAAKSSGSVPLQINGRPADVCPHCGCALFVAKRMPGDREIVRYVECRNRNCRRRFLSSQQPAKLLREVGRDDDDISISGKHNLTLHKDSA